MSVPSVEFWWTYVGGTAIAFVLVAGIVAAVIHNQRVRFRLQGEKLSLAEAAELETQRHLAVARQMQEKLESLSHEMIRMQEDDRRRISREIHDEMGQLFSMLTVNFELIRKYAAKDPG